MFPAVKTWLVLSKLDSSLFAISWLLFRQAWKLSLRHVISLCYDFLLNIYVRYSFYNYWVRRAATLTIESNYSSAVDNLIEEPNFSRVCLGITQMVSYQNLALSMAHWRQELLPVPMWVILVAGCGKRTLTSFSQSAVLSLNVNIKQRMHVK